MTDIEKVIGKAKAAILPFESWERLPGESGAAYAAFCSYRDYGPERNIRKAAAGDCAGEGDADRETRITRKYRLWRGWSTQFRWRERAADYDGYLDRLKQTERRKAIEEREADYRETMGKMLLVVNKKLDSMAPGELTNGAVAEWLTVAFRTDRELAGLVSGDGKDSAGQKPGAITFAPEFEGL
jgi:hypothetical protein